MASDQFWNLWAGLSWTDDELEGWGESSYSGGCRHRPVRVTGLCPKRIWGSSGVLRAGLYGPSGGLSSVLASTGQTDTGNCAGTRSSKLGHTHRPWGHRSKRQLWLVLGPKQSSQPHCRSLHVLLPHAQSPHWLAALVSWGLCSFCFLNSHPMILSMSLRSVLITFFHSWYMGIFVCFFSLFVLRVSLFVYLFKGSVLSLLFFSIVCFLLQYFLLFPFFLLILGLFVLFYPSFSWWNLGHWF